MKAKIERYKLTTEDLQILRAQTPQTLAEWWCELNRWNWVDALGEEEPPKRTPEADGLFHLETTRRNGVMNWIDERVNGKLISRTWNHEMTDEEFEKFWAIHGKAWGG